MLKRFKLVLGGSILFCLVVSAVRAADPLKGEVKEKAPHDAVALEVVLTRLRELEQAYSEVQMEGTQSFQQDLAKPHGKRQSIVRWLQLGDKTKCVDGKAEIGSLGVIVMNPAGTSFSVIRPESGDEPHIVLAAENGGEDYETIAKHLGLALEECRAPFWAEEESIHDLLSSDAITNVRVRELDGKVLITADVKKPSGNVSAISFDIELNPALNYAAERFSWSMTGVDGKPFARMTRVMKYEGADEKTPRLKSTVWDTERFGGSKTTTHCEFHVEKLNFEPPTESEFTLSGSGFEDLDKEYNFVRPFMPAYRWMVSLFTGNTAPDAN